MTGLVTVFRAVLVLACVATLRARLDAQNPAAIEHRLRPPIAPIGSTRHEFVDRMKLFHVPGVSIAVIDSNRLVFAKGFGVKAFGATSPVDTATLFLAGSISKPVFASGVLALVEQGKLSLDVDVNKYLQSWHLPESTFTEHEKVKLRRLLTHTAGLTHRWTSGLRGWQAGAHGAADS